MMVDFALSALLALISLASASPYPPYGRTALAYCTSSDLRYKLSPISPPVQEWRASGYGQKTWDLEIDDTPSGHKQTITGFGAAVTDATVISFNRLRPDRLERLLATLMTPLGSNFALMRHTIGASDLSPDPGYTYDDNETPAGKNTLANFNLGQQGTAMAELLAKMKRWNPEMAILGSSWSAPGWMKLNNAFRPLGNATDNNLSDHYLQKNRTDYSQQFAQYFVKYIQAYKEHGVDINAITIQNEPLNSQPGYPTMYMFDYEQAELIQNHIGPALRNAGLSTSVWAYDHNTDQPSYPQTVLNNAGQYVNTVAWHCYASSTDWTTLTDFHNQNPGVQQFMTECWTPAPNISATSTNWYQAANFTIGPLQNWAQGVLAWTLGTDSQAGPHMSTGGCAECFGLVTIEDDGTYTLNMAYYTMAQFSRFMPKGSIILEGTGSSENPDAPGVQSVASLNPDGTRTVVFMNTLLEELMVRVRMRNGERWSGIVPANSIVTWVLPCIEKQAW